MIFKECKLGWTFESPQVFGLFGNRNSSIDNLKQVFPNLTFRRIKQTHSDIVVESSENVIEADAHLTNENQKALVIATADCMPIMIYCPITNTVAAVHAGWRGIVNQITLKTIRQMIANGSDAEKLTIRIGPHILQNSFEVDTDVMNQIKDSSLEKSAEVFIKNNEKYFINLLKVIEAQIQFVGARIDMMNCLLLDTKSSSNLHSYRRDHSVSGRNLSFICLK